MRGPAGDDGAAAPAAGPVFDEPLHAATASARSAGHPSRRRRRNEGMPHDTRVAAGLTTRWWRSAQRNAHSACRTAPEALHLRQVLANAVVADVVTDFTCR